MSTPILQRRRQGQPQARFLHQGGFRALAEALHTRYGDRITCPQCQESQPLPWKAYHLNEGGNTSGESKRRQFRCRNANRQASTTGYRCPTKACKAYIQRAYDTLGTERVEAARKVVWERLCGRGAPCGNIAQPLCFGNGAERDGEQAETLKQSTSSATIKQTTEERKGVVVSKIEGTTTGGAPGKGGNQQAKQESGIAALKRRAAALTSEEPVPKRRAIAGDLPNLPKASKPPDRPTSLPVDVDQFWKAYSLATELRGVLHDLWQCNKALLWEEQREIPNSTAGSDVVSQTLYPSHSADLIDLTLLDSPLSTPGSPAFDSSNIVVAQPQLDAVKVYTSGKILPKRPSPQPVRRRLFQAFAKPRNGQK